MPSFKCIPVTHTEFYFIEIAVHIFKNRASYMNVGLSDSFEKKVRRMAALSLCFHVKIF
jgi:hypothetical protein